MVYDKLALVRRQARADSDARDTCPHAGSIDFNEMEIVREENRDGTVVARSQGDKCVGNACAASLQLPVRHCPVLVNDRDAVSKSSEASLNEVLGGQHSGVISAVLNSCSAHWPSNYLRSRALEGTAGDFWRDCSTSLSIASEIRSASLKSCPGWKHFEMPTAPSALASLSGMR